MTEKWSHIDGRLDDSSVGVPGPIPSFGSENHGTWIESSSCFVSPDGYDGTIGRTWRHITHLYAICDLVGRVAEPALETIAESCIAQISHH